MFKLLILLMFVLLFNGCRDSKLINEEIIDVKIVNIDPPKHFYLYVDINEKIEKIHISKHCNNMRKDLINSITKIKIKTYQYEDNGEKYYIFYKYYDAKEYCNG